MAAPLRQTPPRQVMAGALYSARMVQIAGRGPVRGTGGGRAAKLAEEERLYVLAPAPTGVAPAAVFPPPRLAECVRRPDAVLPPKGAVGGLVAELVRRLKVARGRRSVPRRVAARAVLMPARGPTPATQHPASRGPVPPDDGVGVSLATLRTPVHRRVPARARAQRAPAPPLAAVRLSALVHGADGPEWAVRAP